MSQIALLCYKRLQPLLNIDLLNIWIQGIHGRLRKTRTKTSESLVKE